MKSFKSMGTLREHIEKVKDPVATEAYLNADLDEYAEFRDLGALLLALRAIITIAQGGGGFLAKKASVNWQNLYKILPGKRSSQLEAMEA